MGDLRSTTGSPIKPGGGVDYIGPWSSSLAYKQGDVVLHNGVEYVAVNDSQNQTPPAIAPPPIEAGEELGYVEVTTNTNVPQGSTSQAAPLTMLSLPAVTFDGSTKIVIDFFWPAASWAAGAASNEIGINLWDDTVDLGNMWLYRTFGAAGPGRAVPPLYGLRRFTPPAGTWTYRIRAWSEVSDASFDAGAGGAGVLVPGFARILVAA